MNDNDMAKAVAKDIINSIDNKVDKVESDRALLCISMLGIGIIIGGVITWIILG